MSSSSLVGEVLDQKYKVVRHIGQGGFGDVYLATDLAIPERNVAIKVLQQGSTVNQYDLINEMRTLAKIQHPNVVGFYHHFIRKGCLNLVMEYCELGSLSDVLGPSHKAPLGQVFNWALELCDTLAVIHEANVTHHDIKPANILFTNNATIKIGDFGIANSLNGTTIYMPPEMMVRHRVSPRDPRPDIYALGITLIEVVAGRHPLLYESREEGIKSRLKQDFLPSDLPKWATEILGKATHPKPELRFQTAEEFAEAIRAKFVPNVFDANQIQAFDLAKKSAASLSRKRWRAAERTARQALTICSNSIAALVSAGRYEIMLRRPEKAEEYFTKAISIDKRAQVQKELAWIKLEKGFVSSAISLLTEHLKFNPSDSDAFNLMLKCYYKSNRFEAGEQLVRMLLNNGSKESFFSSNLFLFTLLGGQVSEEDNQFFEEESESSPLLKYNMTVNSDRASWALNRKVSLKSKLIFHEHFHSFGERSKNDISLSINGNEFEKFDKFVLTIGSSKRNDLVINDRNVSRRHCVLVNCLDDVWLYDLDSTCGTKLDGEAVEGRVFLDGVHQMRIGSTEIRIISKDGLLV
ncbi:protein kinase [bacterium]|nr:protein kinase [bacterium]